MNKYYFVIELLRGSLFDIFELVSESSIINSLLPSLPFPMSLLESCIGSDLKTSVLFS